MIKEIKMGFLLKVLRLVIGATIGFLLFQLVRRFMDPTAGQSETYSSETPNTVAPAGPLMGGDDGLTINEGDLGGEVAPDLLEILVDPADKQPLELVDGKWLVNRRTGRRYPIVTGIPIMLPEVGDKYRDASFITATNGDIPA
jgi:uncharacterized protein YbaR (Trm112 family)